MSGGTGKTITPNEEQRMQISSLVKNMNLKAKKFPRTNGWGYCITYYKDGVANTIVLAGKVTWNGADYKVDKESYDKLKEYMQTDEYVEEIAREKLGLAKDNETVFKKEQ